MPLIMPNVSKPSRLRAYTLIEVLIAVSIIGLASAIVVPHMITASTLGIQAAARSVIADLLYTQNEAITQQSPRQIVFDTNNEKYWLEDGKGNKLSLNWRTGGGDGDLIDFTNDSRFTGVRLATVTIPDGGGDPTFKDDDGLLTFKFDELGTLVSPAKGGHIGLEDNHQKFEIDVAPFTGRVTVKEVQ